MIAVLKQGVNKAQREQLIQWIEAQKVRVHVSEGEFQTVIGLIGDTSRIDIDLLASLEIVEKVSRVSEPFKSASRRFHPDNTVVEVGEGENKVKIGGGHFCMIAGGIHGAPRLKDILLISFGSGRTFFRASIFLAKSGLFSTSFSASLIFSAMFPER